MKSNRYLIISVLMLILGIFFYFYYHEILVIKLFTKQYNINSNSETEKKSFNFYFYKDNKWQSESKQLIVESLKSKKLELVIKAWLNYMISDQKWCKPIELESVIFDINYTQAFISFDRYPFNKNSSINEKLMFIESLLKTVQELNLNIQSVRFLVHHQPIADSHLNFEKPWPINGFSSK